ncbi:6,7-dimethyl-8-ribityllumazine synthase [Corynebacterium pseudopelargi]|uniref:6,7-dimethyl-8-ribityllumazine synthase n=1 Tax=Corynebacterium pseudopelargi TaxID=2080757 RepID=A0A3G6ITX4_9CORY|nr:6,7-dimethyl-8-ribityllumazine synthase [Corynebacterium pseudopelargi]AZA09205.1 6,7-dimethyl-8-ribityllumazine synthase [Corynebacterium pseudopelargi]
MAVAGLPQLDQIQTPGYTVGIVTAMWNQEICDQLHARAKATAKQAGAKVIEVRVPGALELPVVAQKLARTCDAVVALGCVIRGGTPHFDYVCDSVTQGLTRVALDAETPVGNGVLTCNEQQQAVDRAGFEDSQEDKGAEATLAALYSAKALNALPG